MSSKLRVAVISLTVFVVTLLISKAFSQESNGQTIPQPNISFSTFAGEEGSTPDPETTGATIVASIPENQQCECGARFEAKLAETNDWVLLGFYAPIETGDEYLQNEWVYAGNFFQTSKTYDVRVQISNRQGLSSEYGVSQFSMTPFNENDCVDGQFANVKKSSAGTDTEAAVIFSWDKVCQDSREATRYKVYKNGQEAGETDHGANNYAYPGTQNGSTWKIEAYGEEPPNNNASVITECSQIAPKLSAKATTNTAGFRTTVGVARVLQCEKIGTWLRAVIEWYPVQSGSIGEGYAIPPAWLSYSTGANVLINEGQPFRTPDFNYIRGRIERPGFPSYFALNAFDYCSPQGYGQNSREFSYTDPWQQRGWTCQNSSTYDAPNSYNTYQNWVNFDLSVSGGSVWPVTTEFVY